MYFNVRTLLLITGPQQSTLRLNSALLHLEASVESSSIGGSVPKLLTFLSELVSL
jgi:hypothetical protein